MRLKIWQLLLLVTIIAVGLAFYIAQEEIYCTQERAFSIVEMNQYPVGCETICRELATEITNAGHVKTEVPSWIDSVEPLQLEIGLRLPNNWIPTRIRWFQVTRGDATCFVSLKSSPKFVIADVLAYRKLMKHQTAEPDAKLARTIVEELRECRAEWGKQILAQD